MKNNTIIRKNKKLNNKKNDFIYSNRKEKIKN